MKRTVGIILSLLFVIALAAGCNKAEQIADSTLNESDSGTNVYVEKFKPDAVIAEVNGVKLLAGDVIPNYADIVDSYLSEETGDDETGTTEKAEKSVEMSSEQKEQFADEIWQYISDAISNEVKMQKAKELGYDKFSAEDDANVKEQMKQMDESLDMMAQEYKQMGSDEGKQISDEEAKAEALAEFLSTIGMDSIEQYEASVRSDMAVMKMMDDLSSKGVNISDADLTASYNEKLAAQKENPMPYDDITVYYPGKTRKVLAIITQTSDEEDMELQNLSMSGSEEYDKRYEAIMKEKRTLIENAKKMLDDGKKFEDVMLDKSIIGERDEAYLAWIREGQVFLNPEDQKRADEKNEQLYNETTGDDGDIVLEEDGAADEGDVVIEGADAADEETPTIGEAETPASTNVPKGAPAITAETTPAPDAAEPATGNQSASPSEDEVLDVEVEPADTETLNDAVFKLKNVGDVSDIIDHDSGYVIFKYIEETPGGDVPIDQVKNYLKDELMSLKQGEYQDQLLEQWKKEMQDAGKIKVYAEVAGI